MTRSDRGAERAAVEAERLDPLGGRPEGGSSGFARRRGGGPPRRVRASRDVRGGLEPLGEEASARRRRSGSRGRPRRGRVRAGRRGRRALRGAPRPERRAPGPRPRPPGRLLDEGGHAADAAVGPAGRLGELAREAPGFLEEAAQLGGRLLERRAGLARAGREERDVQAEEVRPVGEAGDGRGEREEGVGGARELRQAPAQPSVERRRPARAAARRLRTSSARRERSSEIRSAVATALSTLSVPDSGGDGLVQHRGPARPEAAASGAVPPRPRGPAPRPRCSPRGARRGRREPRRGGRRRRSRPGEGRRRRRAAGGGRRARWRSRCSGERSRGSGSAAGAGRLRGRAAARWSRSLCARARAPSAGRSTSKRARRGRPRGGGRGRAPSGLESVHRAGASRLNSRPACRRRSSSARVATTPPDAAIRGSSRAPSRGARPAPRRRSRSAPRRGRSSAAASPLRAPPSRRASGVSTTARSTRRSCGGLVEAAARLRERFVPPETDGYRLVHAEGDGLPGLVVDRYADVLVLQATTAGTEAARPLWLPALRALFPAASILQRNDVASRHGEGLPLEDELLAGRGRRGACRSARGA